MSPYNKYNNLLDVVKRALPDMVVLSETNAKLVVDCGELSIYLLLLLYIFGLQMLLSY